MNPSKREEDTRKTGLQLKPLCLFRCPDDTSTVFFEGPTYINPVSKEELEARSEKPKTCSKPLLQQKENVWLRRRTEARIRRRRMQEPMRHLKTYLIASVKNETVLQKSVLPSLFEVLETVKDAWPSSSSRNIDHLRRKDKLPAAPSLGNMKDEQNNIRFSSSLLNRRFSMPEELMRKYSKAKEATSEDSEANRTAIEITSSSSTTFEKEETVRKTEELESQRNTETVKVPEKVDVGQQTNEKNFKTYLNLPKRVTQKDYNHQGKLIIKTKAADKTSSTCRSDKASSATASAKEESDYGGTSDSIPSSSSSSSSPFQLPKNESSSGNLSSDSDYVRCTCAELTSSKETSTDLFHSGKSTLSQTVSDKSMSTQDSTVSINSVSTRGSTVTDNSNSTTPEMEKTSAKETTTSPDYSSRTPRSKMNRKNRRRDKYLYSEHKNSCPRHGNIKHSKNHSETYRKYPLHSKHQEEITKMVSCGINTEETHGKNEVEVPESKRNGFTIEIGVPVHKEQTEDKETERYQWAKLSEEELYLMQQLRHKKFIEKQQSVSIPVRGQADADSMGASETGSTHKETEFIEQPIMIPRYSALPRTLSMLVNTSSGDTSIHSDSDNQSLADSLEDQPIAHVHKLYFDTKKESKPVRGDVHLVQEHKLKHKEPRGRAFFVSIKDPFGEDEMLDSIEKIPQPPERIKKHIFERHLSVCAKHKHSHDVKKDEQKGKRKTRTRNEKAGKTTKDKKTECVGQNSQKKNDKVSTKPKEPAKNESDIRKKETNEQKGRYNSKIPILVSSRSTSSSPEREEVTQKPKPTRPKIRVKKEAKLETEQKEIAEKATVERTQILEITQTGKELNLQKPQAIIHPSQIPNDPNPTIPPLMPTLRVPLPFRQIWNKPILAQIKRSPVGRFRQRFEVIPEEKSSSLSSSAEEKNVSDAVLPKFTDASTSPLLEDAPKSDKIHFQSLNVNDVSNLIVAKITNKQLETLPYVNDDNQKIILFSSKKQNSNSCKGRDALIAMNRGDFNRLAKGWMNFYRLSENPENEDNEENPKAKAESQKGNEKQGTDKCLSQPKGQSKEPAELNAECLRFHSSNTILQETSKESGQSAKSAFNNYSLPELKLPTQRKKEGNDGPPKLSKKLEEDDDDDDDDDNTDSTDYMEPPSPRVPPLPLADFPSDATISSSDSELDNLKPKPGVPPLKHVHIKKRGRTNRTRPQKESHFETSRFGRKKNSGWSVTVAGTVELSRSAPDLEMRLSFPMKGGPPVISQSDSGFAEDSNYSKISESTQDLSKQEWTVTVKNPKQGVQEVKFPKNSSDRLPNLEEAKNAKIKDRQLDDKLKRIIERKMYAIWPQVQEVIQKEFLTESGRLIADLNDTDFCLSVRGNAISLERKPKAVTMTERDITRKSHASRENS